jgi:hypothetical protein
MATLGDLRDAIVDTLEATLPGWNVYRLPPENITAPAVMVMGFDIAPATFAAAQATVTVELLAAVSHRHVDQIDELDELLSPNGKSSLWKFLGDDPTLGGVVGYCVVQAVGEYRQLLIADVGYYGATVSLSAVI